jgi:hypothetical protein
MRGVPDSIVLVLDFSEYDRQESIDELFQIWQQKVIENPQLWRQGFTIQTLRLFLREMADDYGKDIIDGLQFWRRAS